MRPSPLTAVIRRITADVTKPDDAPASTAQPDAGDACTGLDSSVTTPHDGAAPDAGTAGANTPAPQGDTASPDPHAATDH